LLEDGKELGCPVEGILGAADDSSHGVYEIVAVAGSGLGLLGRFARHREDRSLLRLHDGLVREVGAAAQSTRQ
jgi:hypothetical protein